MHFWILAYTQHVLMQRKCTSHANISHNSCIFEYEGMPDRIQDPKCIWFIEAIRLWCHPSTGTDDTGLDSGLDRRCRGEGGAGQKRVQKEGFGHTGTRFGQKRFQSRRRRPSWEWVCARRCRVFKRYKSVSVTHQHHTVLMCGAEAKLRWPAPNIFQNIQKTYQGWIEASQNWKVWKSTINNRPTA